MAHEPITFRSITVRNFRGFRDEQTIELDSSAVIISGPNGTGKTSFFDAIQWLLIGALPRLAALTSRRSDDHIVNRFGQGEPAYVAAQLSLRGEPVQLMRAGNARSSILELHGGEGRLRGDEAEKKLTEALLTHGDVTLEDALLTSGILQQDVVRLVLQDEPKKRYRHMASLLGLEDLAGFEEHVKQRAASEGRVAADAREQHAAAETQARSAEAELQRLSERLRAQPELATVRDDLTRRLGSEASALIVGELPTDLAGSTGLGQAARQLRNRAEQLITEQDILIQQETAVQTVDDEELDALVQELEHAHEALSEAEAAEQEARSRLAEAEERSGQMVALAARAIELLGTSCPVCEQSIDEGHVATHLRQVIESDGVDLTGLKTLLTQADEARHARAERRAFLELRLSGMHAAKQNAEKTSAARTTWIVACARLATSSDRVTVSEGDRVAVGDVSALRRLRDAADRLAGVADELVTVLGGSTLAEQVERQRAVLDELRGRADILRDAASTDSQRAEDAKTLRDATTRAIAAVTAIRFTQLQPLVDDIFGRLDPHPVFTTLRFELDVSYRAGVADPIVEDDEGVQGDPLLIFSSSQANVAALTYFLALSWTAEGHALPFLLLDDPLQSMDDVNVLGFSDLCRHIRRGRQLIVSTHEQRLAGLLERKLAPRGDGGGLRVVRFVGWDRSGPKIDTSVIEAQNEVGYLLGAI